MKHILVALLLASIVGTKTYCQSATPQVNTVQPKIIVIPYTKEGEDIRTILEQDVNKRIAITKIIESFESRGFTTVDFVAKLKAAKDNNIFTSENQTDIKTQIVQMSGADVYVQAEVNVNLKSSGNYIDLILNAFEASTGNHVSTIVGKSKQVYTDDIGKLASLAVENCITDFLNTMQSKFTDIVTNGKSVLVEVSFDMASKYKMSSEVGTDKLALSDQLETWMEKHAYKNNYHLQGTTDVKMIFDDVRIPLKDPNTNNNYNPNKFARAISDFLKDLGLVSGKDIKGNTIYITIK